MKQTEAHIQVRYIIAEHEPLTAAYLISLIKEVRQNYLLVGVIEEAEEAISYYSSGCVDLMIYDLELPDTHPAVQINDMLANRPVIFISDYDSVTDSIPPSMVGRVLLKPLSKTEINSTLSVIESSMSLGRPR